jgi:hypothetical protein
MQPHKGQNVDLTCMLKVPPASIKNTKYLARVETEGTKLSNQLDGLAEISKPHPCPFKKCNLIQFDNILFML